MTATLTSTAPGARPKASATTIAAITIGNGLEFFDFAVYGFFAVLIGSIFFPAKDAVDSLMLAVGSYGLSLLARPLGGVVLGLYADRAGRKPAMTLTLILMAAGSLGVAVAPTYAQIGVLAPIWLICARLVQGFALGGEVGASTSLLLEYADDHNRGYFGSWQFFSQGLAGVLGAAFAAVLTNTLSHDALYAWGWRIPFFIGALTVPVGVYIRRHLDETLGHQPQAGESSKAKLKEVLQTHAGLVWSGVLLLLGSTIATYIVAYYFSSYATQFLKMPLSLTLWANVTATCVIALTAVFAGKLADRIGRKPLIAWSRLALVVLVLPCFMLLDTYRSAPALMGVVAAMGLLLTLQTVPVIVMLTEIFPRPIRATSLSIVYSLGVAVFGGTAQLFVTWLISATGSNLAPAWYLIVGTLISTIPLIWLKDMNGKPI